MDIFGYSFFVSFILAPLPGLLVSFLKRFNEEKASEWSLSFLIILDTLLCALGRWQRKSWRSWPTNMVVCFQRSIRIQLRDRPLLTWPWFCFQFHFKCALKIQALQMQYLYVLYFQLSGHFSLLVKDGFIWNSFQKNILAPFTLSATFLLVSPISLLILFMTVRENSIIWSSKTHPTLLKWNSIWALILDGDDIKDANFQEVSFWLAVIFTANMILFIFFYFCYSLPRKNRPISETTQTSDGKEIENEDEYCEL